MIFGETRYKMVGKNVSVLLGFILVIRCRGIGSGTRVVVICCTDNCVSMDSGR